MYLYNMLYNSCDTKVTRLKTKRVREKIKFVITVLLRKQKNTFHLTAPCDATKDYEMTF